MDDPLYPATIPVGGNASSFKFKAFGDRLHSDQSFILQLTFTDPNTAGAFDISSATATLYISVYKDITFDPVPLASGSVTDSGSGTNDRVTFTVAKDVIPDTIAGFPLRLPGNAVIIAILEDGDSKLQFIQEINVYDSGYGLTGESEPSSNVIIPVGNDLGSVENLTTTVPPTPTLNEAYIVAAGATGDWAGQDNNLAIGNGATWIFFTPVEGNFVYDKSTNLQDLYDGAAWAVNWISSVVQDLTPQAGGVFSMNSFQMQLAKGADVASAGALTLLTDGNYFDITGTTTVISIGTLAIGTVVRLHFDGILILTHHATDLILPTAGNITTAAGDEAVFVEYATGDWRCVNYSRADGTALVGSGAGDMTAAVYDAAAITEQLVGLTASQTLTNKTVNGVVLNTAGASTAFLNEAGAYTTPAGGGDMTAAVYDPNTVAGDAFDQDNMVDGTTNKNYTATEKTKLSGIETAADVTDETNVVAALDGATLTGVTVAGTDKVVIQDVSDSDNIKTVTAQSIADLGGGGTDADAIHVNVAAEITGITEKTSYATDDELVMEDSAAADAKKSIKAKTLLAQSVITTDATAAYTGVLTDEGKDISMTSASANVFTIPTNASVAYPINMNQAVFQDGTGITTVTASSGVSLNGVTAGSITIGTQYAGLLLTKTGTDTWIARASAVSDWIKISSASASASATIEFTDLSSLYSMYVVVINNLLPATDATSLYIRTSTDNGSTFNSGATDYEHVKHLIDASTTHSVSGSTDDSKIILASSIGTGTGEGLDGKVTIFNPSNASRYKNIEGSFSSFDSANASSQQISSGTRKGTADVDAIQFLMSSGNITSGEFILYGVLK